MTQIKTDLAIVGGGTAGLAAAVAAAGKGARVIIFEKASTAGGTGNMAMGPFAVESRLQKAKKYALTKEEAFRIHMDFTHWRVDARLVKAYIDKSASTIDWLEDMGVEFAGIECHNRGFNYTWHPVRLDGGGTGPGAGAVMMRALTMKAKELGVQILFRTPAKKVLKEAGGVRGLLAEDSSGDEIEVSAKAVIIATGGFGDNPEMIKKQTGYEWGSDLMSMRIPGLVGNGIHMALDAGAAATEMTMHVTCGGTIEMEGLVEAAFTFWQPNLMVNLHAERFMNEEIFQTTPFGPNAVAIQKNRCAFVIFDENTKRYYQEVGLDFPPGVMASTPFTKVLGFDAEIERAIAGGGDSGVFVVNNFEELASKIGLDPVALLATINEYNKACETGRDELFGKDPKYLRRIEEPKFYAAKLVMTGFGSLGGIKINHKTEVMNKAHEAIPGLYAAGVDANSIYGDTYVFLLPGNTFGFALNSGRMAGENAAEYAGTLSR
jgi:fumarate reductase flavoprotein subunit